MIAEIPDKILLCIIDNKNGFQIDAELPSRMPASELSVGLLRLLQAYEPLKYANYTTVELWTDSKKLQADQTLASEKLWDGSELYLLFPRNQSST